MTVLATRFLWKGTDETRMIIKDFLITVQSNLSKLLSLDSDAFDFHIDFEFFSQK